MGLILIQFRVWFVDSDFFTVPHSWHVERSIFSYFLGVDQGEMCATNVAIVSISGYKLPRAPMWGQHTGNTFVQLEIAKYKINVLCHHPPLNKFACYRSKWDIASTFCNMKISCAHRWQIKSTTNEANLHCNIVAWQVTKNCCLCNTWP